MYLTQLQCRSVHFNEPGPESIHKKFIESCNFDMVLMNSFEINILNLLFERWQVRIERRRDYIVGEWKPSTRVCR